MKWIALLMVVAGCGGGGSGDESAAPVVAVRVAQAQIGTIAQPIEVAGTITPRFEAAVSSKLSGQITRMPLLLNRAVHRGDELARIEAADVAAQRAEAAAAVTTARNAVPPAQAAVETARRTLERRRDLYDKGGISLKDVEASQLDLANAEGALKEANSRVAEAEQHLASSSAQLGYSSIRAPFVGIVTEQFAHQGDYATAGSKLLTVADASTVIVKAPVPDEMATRIRSGDAATVQPAGSPGTTINAHVTLVGRGSDPQSHSSEVWITLPNSDGRLRPNEAARVTLASAPIANAVIVPTSAVTLDATTANGGTVMLVDAKSIAHEVRVTVGGHDATRTQITSGLRGGETVVTEGNYGLPEGTRVTVAQP
jgi:RND family efflux transporter MFP subunit